jgi:CheY-like chemotaxis protein
MVQTFDASVLLVEDYPVNQELTQEMLEMMGCKVEIAENGKQALEILKEKRFDLILMDIQMPEMDGYECSLLIRKMESVSKTTPIVALTANALQGDKEKCISAGMDDYISKPFRMADLEAVLMRQLKKTPL